MDAERARFILVAPSHCGNIGAAARAIRTMGFHSLSVVAPRNPGFRDSAEALALAVNAHPTLRAAGQHASTVEALQGVNMAIAMTGYAREFGPPHVSLREAAQRAAHWLQTGQGTVAFLFGTERSGLQNSDVQRCRFSCAIEADAQFASLNLAQAVQVTAYALRCALDAPTDAPPPRAPEAAAARATVEHSERFFEALERALTVIGFHDPSHPRRLMPRLRSLFSRAELTALEMDILLGICAAIIEPKRLRAGRKASRQQ